MLPQPARQPHWRCSGITEGFCIPGQLTHWHLVQNPRAQAVPSYKSISSSHSTLIQWAEEKLALSVIASELVDHHLSQLDKDIISVQSEVEVCQLPNSVNRLFSHACLQHGSAGTRNATSLRSCTHAVEHR